MIHKRIYSKEYLTKILSNEDLIKLFYNDLLIKLTQRINGNCDFEFGQYLVLNYSHNIEITYWVNSYNSIILRQIYELDNKRSRSNGRIKFKMDIIDFLSLFIKDELEINIFIEKILYKTLT